MDDLVFFIHDEEMCKHLNHHKIYLVLKIFISYFLGKFSISSKRNHQCLDKLNMALARTLKHSLRTAKGLSGLDL